MVRGKAFFHHALKVVREKCIGCTHCMDVCPTDAVRIRGGKAYVNPDRCIDCGRCVNACPYNAIIVEQDDFGHIFDFKYRVALVPSVLLGQFNDKTGSCAIFKGLHNVGFTHVYEVDAMAPIVEKAYAEYEKRDDVELPIISSFCPAIVRLIQVRFPSLVKNIALVKPPIDFAAIHCRNIIEKAGASPSEIGVFYITPCAAKIAAVKSPVGEEKSFVNGVINMDFIYNKIYSHVMLDNKGDKSEPCLTINSRYVKWSLTNGECKNRDSHALAVDGVKNVIEILDQLENDKLDNINFLELRACDESCAGGVLVPGNRFLTVRRLSERAEIPLCDVRKMPKGEESCKNCYLFSETDESYLLKNSGLGKMEPRSMLSLDDDMSEALKKMEYVEVIMQILPNVDCGMCGTPSCLSLAEDIVRGIADIDQCIFMKINSTSKNGDIESLCDSVRNVWGRINNDGEENESE